MADAKKNYREKFSGPPFQTSKKFRAPLFAMKITGQPHRKACKLNFPWKICGNFFQAPPLQGSKFEGPPFFNQAPLTSVCERSLSNYYSKHIVE